MTLKPKSLWWKFTFPFAHNNFTAIGETLYHPKGVTVPSHVYDHEVIHSLQQKHEGLVKFILLYLFVCPILWNPWRKKWEFEAYVLGTKLTADYTRKLLRSYKYGWLL